MLKKRIFFFFFKKGTIEILVPDTKFYDPLFHAIFTHFCEFCLCKDHTVESTSVNSVVFLVRKLLAFSWIDVYLLEDFKYNIPTAVHDCKACH